MRILGRKKLVLGLVVMTLLFTTLIGCGKDDVVKGKWQVVNSGITLEKENENMVDQLYYNLYSMLFAKGNTFEFIDNNKVIINGIKGSYELEGDKLTISDGQTDIVFDINVDEQMVLEVNGFAVILEKN